MKKGMFYCQNVILNRDEQFYQEIGKETITVDAPSIDEVENFLKDIWSEEKGFNEWAEWMKHTKNKWKETTSEME